MATKPKYLIHNTSHSVETRTARKVAPGNPKTRLFLKGGMFHVLRGRPLAVSEELLGDLRQELLPIEKAGRCKVTDLKGLRVPLEELGPTGAEAPDSFGAGGGSGGTGASGASGATAGSSEEASGASGAQQGGEEVPVVAAPEETPGGHNASGEPTGDFQADQPNEATEGVSEEEGQHAVEDQQGGEEEPDASEGHEDHSEGQPEGTGSHKRHTHKKKKR